MSGRETDTVPARGGTERGASERGSGTVLVLGMIAALVLRVGLVHLLSASATAGSLRKCRRKNHSAPCGGLT